jgi:hypothetical protein
MFRLQFPYSCPNPPRPGPHRAAWGAKPWYIVFKNGRRYYKRFRTRREAAREYKYLRMFNPRRGG